MPKVKVFKPNKNSASIRKAFLFHYTEKFFNKWMSKYDFIGLNYQQKHYIMRKFWSVGSVAVSSIGSANKELAGLMASGQIDMKENSIIFTPWTIAQRYNIYDFPTHIRLINTRGVKFITEKDLALDKEAVVIYAQKNHKSVYSSIETKLKELVDIEMKIRTARKAQSQAWLFTFSQEDFEQAKALHQQLENDEPFIYVPLQDPDRAKGLTSGAPYINDKLEQERQKVENDILTMLGFNNVGIAEKKEHLVVDEVNANNQDIEQSSFSFTYQLEEDFERANKVLPNCNILVVDLTKEYNESEDEVNEEEDNEDVSND